MLGIFLARGVAAAQRQSALASRRLRITTACIRGAPATTASTSCAAGASGLRRQLATVVDHFDSSGFGSEVGGKQEASERQDHGQQWQTASAYVGDEEGEGEAWNRHRNGRRDGPHPSGTVRGRGRGREGGGRTGKGARGSRHGGEFDRDSGGGKGEVEPRWQYAHKMQELRRTGDWIKAIEIYKDACDNKDLEVDRVMYNSTIVALSRSPRWQVALSIFQEMRDAGTTTPDTYTYNGALMACVHGRQGDLAFSLFDEMREDGIKPDCFTFTHMVTICGQDGAWQTAFSLVEEMKAAGLRPNCVTYNSVIVACGNGGEPDRAVAVLDRMRDEGVQISEGTFSAAIAACGKAGEWEQALDLLEQMKDGRDNLAPNEYCYNSAISACERAGMWRHALVLLRDMQVGQLIVTAGSYSHVIKACINADEIDEARGLIDEMRANGLRVKAGMVSMVARMEDDRNARRGHIKSPQALKAVPAEAEGTDACRRPALYESPDLDDGLTRAPPPTLAASWSDGSPTAVHSAVTPLAPSVNEWSRAAVKAPMEARTALSDQSAVGETGGDGLAARGSSIVASRRSRVQPTKDFLRDISAFSRKRQWSEILVHLDRAMANPGIKVSMRMYESCLAGLASGGRWAEALAVLERIQGAGLKPNPRCSTAAIKACAEANPPKWGLALLLLRDLETPWVWAYVSALSALGRAGRWKAGAKLLEEMKAVGVEPNVFCYHGVLAACRLADPPQWQQACSVLSQMKADGVHPNENCYKMAILTCQAASEHGEAEALMSEMVVAGLSPQEECKVPNGVVESPSP